MGYFFHIAIANRGCTFGIATKAFNLDAKMLGRKEVVLMESKLKRQMEITHSEIHEIPITKLCFYSCHMSNYHSPDPLSDIHKGKHINRI